MDVPCRIRPASLADVPALAELERVCFSDPWTASGIQETIQYETARAFVACEEDSLVGYVMARISGQEGEILDLAVLPGKRRHGIGSRLLQAVRQAMASAGVRELYLEVRESNVAAIALYRAQGFRPTGMRSNYYRNPPESALVLRAAL
ncbi:MAG TPA: ribosomal protein S18-alanine N-acetyltransferase [Gemmatimonadales bacterium]|jgi:ribosomal-protein-alanine N-acetyltransferase|nr:ribosomal protein S18-alanine N-acetyltransferase [Gemmatimonadales bacterium]